MNPPGYRGVDFITTPIARDSPSESKIYSPTGDGKLKTVTHLRNDRFDVTSWCFLFFSGRRDVKKKANGPWVAELRNFRNLSSDVLRPARSIIEESCPAFFPLARSCSSEEFLREFTWSHRNLSCSPVVIYRLLRRRWSTRLHCNLSRTFFHFL